MILAAAWCLCAPALLPRPPQPPPARFDVHRVDVNRAPPAELRCLPGVGPVLARRIVEERRRGVFGQAADLERVHGIGPALVRRVAPFTVFRTAAARDP